jgi:hypothetical protein
MANVFSMEPVEYECTNNVVSMNATNVDTTPGAVPEPTSNVPTMLAYIERFKAVSDLLALYKTLVQNDDKMLKDVHDTYVAAEDTNLSFAKYAGKR